MAQLIELHSFKAAGGIQRVYKHLSDKCQASMLFSIFLPSRAFKDPGQTELVNQPTLPVLYWLAGRGCSTDDFIYGTNFQRHAERLGFVVVSPDTSPRDVYEFEENDPYEGAGASYYLNAAPHSRFAKHYQMFDYVTEELPAVVQHHFPVIDRARAGIFGHSMGGHGALIAALKRPDLYKSVSVLAPLANLVNCGRNSMLISYLGNDYNRWLEWDATELARNYKHERKLDILIDQGTEDPLLDALLPHRVAEAIGPNSNLTCKLNMRQGFDHSYDFICAFIAQHFDHHAKYLHS